MKFNFILQAIIFGLVGIFISGFTAIGLLGLQMLVSKTGIDCPTAWTIIWTFSAFASLILATLFYRYIKVLTVNKTSRLEFLFPVFNLFQYIFIQASLIPLFTNGKTLCYVSDGQNGLELVFTAWLSIPILIVMSVVFDRTANK